MADNDEAPKQGVRRSSTTASAVQQTVGRLRSVSVTAANKLLETNPSRGMWQATGTAIAHAPNIKDLRSQGEVHFDAHGHSARDKHAREIREEWKMERRATLTSLSAIQSENEQKTGKDPSELEAEATSETTPIEDGDTDSIPPKASWGVATKRALRAAWKFIITPTGFFITIYGLNVVAWGAMLFFLLLKVGPMNQEQKDIWVEIDSQILNALFCVTGFGLVPWRFRDLYWLTIWRLSSGPRSKESIRRLAERNKSWFRRRECDMTVDDEYIAHFDHQQTYSGEVAPPTAPWKMDFVVQCMCFNTYFQVGMATFMWYYNRHNRPSFGVGLFIGLGCLSSLMAGLMSWWEGRKIKIIEGPKLKPKKAKQEEDV